MDFEKIYREANEDNLGLISNKVNSGDNNTFAVNVRNGKRTHQVSVNADRDINEDFDFDKELGLYVSKYKTKYGARDSFAE